MPWRCAACVCHHEPCASLCRLADGFAETQDEAEGRGLPGELDLGTPMNLKQFDKVGAKPAQRRACRSRGRPTRSCHAAVASVPNAPPHASALAAHPPMHPPHTHPPHPHTHNPTTPSPNPQPQVMALVEDLDRGEPDGFREECDQAFQLQVRRRRCPPWDVRLDARTL